MTVPDSDSPYVVEDARQAGLLSDPRSAAFFKPFLAQERTVSQAAAELGCNLNTLLYRVRTLLDSGLLHVTRIERRAGRAVKHYRSVHDAYFVPFGLTSYATLEDRLAAQSGPLFGLLVRAYGEALRRTEHLGRSFLRDEQGVVLTTDFPAPQQTPGGQPVVFYDATLNLNAAEARALGESLKMVFGAGARSGKSAADPSGQGYLLTVALLPLAQADQIERPIHSTEP